MTEVYSAYHVVHILNNSVPHEALLYAEDSSGSSHVPSCFVNVTGMKNLLLLFFGLNEAK